MMHIYLEFWRTNTVAAFLWHGVLIGALLLGIHDYRRERAGARHF
jgi:hypothetical protein